MRPIVLIASRFFFFFFFFFSSSSFLLKRICSNVDVNGKIWYGVGVKLKEH